MHLCPLTNHNLVTLMKNLSLIVSDINVIFKLVSDLNITIDFVKGTNVNKTCEWNKTINFEMGVLRKQKCKMQHSEMLIALDELVDTLGDDTKCHDSELFSCIFYKIVK